MPQRILPSLAFALIASTSATADNGLPDDYDIWGISGQIVSVTAEGINCVTATKTEAPTKTLR